MTDQPINPLMERRRTGVVTRMELGSEIAREQLQAHVDMLNAKGWVRASGKFYFVGKVDNDRLGVMREGERTQEQPS